jgi:hypothetical protein
MAYALRRPRVRLSEHELLALMRFALSVAVLLLVAWSSADPDLWGHVRFGEDILDHREIASRDPYSFTSDRPWVNHEWLAEVFMALGFRAGAATGLIVLKGALVAGTLVVISKSLRRVSWRPVDHDLLIGLAIVGTFSRIHLMRPQVFSVFLFAALLFLLITADRGDRRPLILAPLVMLAWANLHGGWTVGFGVISIWVLVRFLGSHGADRLWLGLLWTGSVAATLVNPYGTGLWTFLRETVGPSRRGIADWQPLLDLPVVLIVPVVMVGLTALVAVWKGRRRTDPAYVLIVLALAVATVRISRFDAFFAIAVVMLLGPYLGRSRAPIEIVGRRWDTLLRRPVPVIIALAVVAASAGVGAPAIAGMTLHDEPEPQATAFLKHRANSRVLTFFDWGEYAIWHLAPLVKVSMDGRRETVYSQELFDAHLRLYYDEPGGTALVSRVRPDLIWLPVKLRVVARLMREGWTPVFRGPRSVILAPGGPARPVRVTAESRDRRCFPDP